MYGTPHAQEVIRSGTADASQSANSSPYDIRMSRCTICLGLLRCLPRVCFPEK